MKMTIGAFLFERLRQMGVSHVFGVPGDYNLQLLEQMKETQGIEFVGTCNELNASYAADGYARINGMGALFTTYGVGDLSAICGLAGSCAEHVPVVLISGTPPLYAMESRLRVHHSLAEGNFDNISSCLAQFTGSFVRLTPANAAGEIDRVLTRCYWEKVPVYLQVPSDISYLEIEVPENKLIPALPKSDQERLESAGKRIEAMLAQAERPVLLVDADADRCGLAEDLYKLVKMRGIPYAAFRTGKAILTEQDSLYLGIYSGSASRPKVLEAVKQSDCVIATAPCFIEASPMAAPQNLPSSASIYIRDFSVTIEGEVYEGVTARELIRNLADHMQQMEGQEEKENLKEKIPEIWVKGITDKKELNVEKGKPLTQDFFWKRLENFLKEGDLICVENGTSMTAMTNLCLPDKARYIAQPIWGSIGYSLPALLGAMTAKPDRRAILTIGDGSFQMTVQELSTILHRGLKPIIFLLNNKGYTIERYILGKNADYNDVANWSYSKLPAVFAPECSVYCPVVRTEEELEAALAEAEKGEKASLIELCLDSEDAPEALKKFGAITAKLDYGPRGPQGQETI